MPPRRTRHAARRATACAGVLTGPPPTAPARRRCRPRPRPPCPSRRATDETAPSTSRAHSERPSGRELPRQPGRDRHADEPGCHLVQPDGAAPGRRGRRRRAAARPRRRARRNRRRRRRWARRRSGRGTRRRAPRPRRGALPSRPLGIRSRKSSPTVIATTKTVTVSPVDDELVQERSRRSRTARRRATAMPERQHGPGARQRAGGKDRAHGATSVPPATARARGPA